MAYSTSPPVEMDVNASERGRIIGSSVAIFIITDIFVLLRLVSRKKARAGYWVSMLYEMLQGALDC